MIQLCLDNAINGANVHTLRIVKMAFALNASVEVNLENYVAFGNGLGRANRFTSTASGTTFGIDITGLMLKGDGKIPLFAVNRENGEKIENRGNKVNTG